MKLKNRSGCPIASTLDLVGDKWTLVLIRDLMSGKKRYSQFRDSPERITTNILADRLSRMELIGLIVRKPYQDNPLRHEYFLSPMGEALRPVLRQMCIWANAHLPGTWAPPDSFMSSKSLSGPHKIDGKS